MQNRDKKLVQILVRCQLKRKIWKPENLREGNIKENVATNTVGCEAVK